jgi:hypothetical protein
MFLGVPTQLVMFQSCLLLGSLQVRSLEAWAPSLSAVHSLTVKSPGGGNRFGSPRSMSSGSNDSDPTRVVVTGLGVISGCGIGHDDFFQACLDGKSSLGVVQRFDVTHYPCQIASEVPDHMFDPNDFFVNPKNVRSNDRFTHFAVAAARQAVQDAGLGDTPETLQNPDRVGCMVGTAFGGVETFERETLKLAQKPERPKVRVRSVATLESENSHQSPKFSSFEPSLKMSEFRSATLPDRSHPLPSPHSSATQHLVLLALKSGVVDQTMVSRPPVPVVDTPLEKPWA